MERDQRRGGQRSWAITENGTFLIAFRSENLNVGQSHPTDTKSGSEADRLVHGLQQVAEENNERTQLCSLQDLKGPVCPAPQGCDRDQCKEPASYSKLFWLTKHRSDDGVKFTEEKQEVRHSDKEKNNLEGKSKEKPYNERSLSTLHARCQRLEQDNATLLKTITEMEDESMKSATQHLLQYDRAGSNVRAVQLWADRQIRDAQQDLEKTRAERQEPLTVLNVQLQACEEKVQEAQKHVQQLREYRDRGHSVAVLQAADLERQLRILSETHQDQAVDVEALAQTELQKLLDDQQKVKEDALQAVIEQHIECLPLSLRRMCLQNKEMKRDIQAYQQMVVELQDEVLILQESGDSLCKSWKEERDRFCRELLLGKPSCSPDEDVVLNIPHSQKMPV